MRQIHWRKWFQILTEKDEGSFINAICYFQNYPWMYEARALSEEERAEKGYAIENRVTQYKRHFFLDLWLFTIYIQWFSKDTSTPNPSIPLELSE